MKTFDEYTSLRVSVHWRSGKTPISPATLHYKLVNKTKRQTVIDWTSITPSADAAVDLDAQLVKCLGRQNQEEQEITFAADKGTSEQVTKVKSWLVRNNYAT